jgi:Fe-S-cluster containining protein
MSLDEGILIASDPRAKGKNLQWDKDPTGPFVALKAGPCPFLSGNACTIYDIRPYNCRRFACFRPSPRQEPFDSSGALGCRNFEDRFLVSRAVRRAAAAIQQKAMTWARAHGWSDHDVRRNR